MSFLTARWESLLLLNYACPAELLAPLVPAGTELDLWQGEALVSVVGFLFRDTRLLGVPVPFHRHFEEVNLRFYVTREEGGETRRAVAFVREIVPRRAIAAVARLAYNEPYVAAPMDHTVALDPEAGGTVDYRWRHRGERFTLSASATGPAAFAEPDTEARFITEHYWGYTRQRDGGTVAYRVEHPSWRLWGAHDAAFTGDASALYGPALAAVVAGTPQSAFLAVGSEVSVSPGRRIALG
ncbi:YqjF family protein [Rubrivirga sp. IMCC43871]|uniref:YqjF family protein n=1 Tax=Rubrivirga sp. IMCC43871 TaxID=3391575 RepID=UPI00399036AD